MGSTYPDDESEFSGEVDMRREIALGFRRNNFLLWFFFYFKAALEVHIYV